MRRRRAISNNLVDITYSKLFNYTENPLQVTLLPGTYKLECWGAQGMYKKNNTSIGYNYFNGGYACGTIILNAPTTLYLYVGGYNHYSGYSSRGGWNGGGASLEGDTTNDNGPGGGASDICLVYSDVTLDSSSRYVRSNASYLSRIIVAGGGGGGRNNTNSCGGYCPTNGTSANYAGGMTSVSSLNYGVTAGFGFGGTGNNTSDDYAGGGGGWYGGQSAGDQGGGGGSSFVWSDEHASYIPSGYTPDVKYKMTDISCLSGMTSMPSPRVCQQLTGLKGCGNIRITGIYKGKKEEHEYVDLGLPSGTLWATTNMGAENPEDFGDYYYFGATMTEKAVYQSDTSVTTFTKYTTSGAELELDDDAAYNNIKGSWKIPTTTLFNELIAYDNTTKEFVTINSKKCMKFTSKINGNYIILPLAGLFNLNSGNYSLIQGTGNYGHYMANTINSNSAVNVLALGMTYSGSEFFPSFTVGNSDRVYICYTIRPIKG